MKWVFPRHQSEATHLFTTRLLLVLTVPWPDPEPFEHLSSQVVTHYYMPNRSLHILIDAFHDAKSGSMTSALLPRAFAWRPSAGKAVP